MSDSIQLSVESINASVNIEESVEELQQKFSITSSIDQSVNIQFSLNSDHIHIAESVQLQSQQPVSAQVVAKVPFEQVSQNKIRELPLESRKDIDDEIDPYVDAPIHHQVVSAQNEAKTETKELISEQEKHENAVEKQQTMAVQVVHQQHYTIEQAPLTQPVETINTTHQQNAVEQIIQASHKQQMVANGAQNQQILQVFGQDDKGQQIVQVIHEQAGQVVQAIQQPQVQQAVIQNQHQQQQIPKAHIEPQVPQMVQQQPVTLAQLESYLAKSNELKSKGNDLFKAKKFEQAVKTYTEALQASDPKLFTLNDLTIYQKMIDLNLVLLLNIASAYYNMENYIAAERFCSQVIQLKPKHFKAYYKRALCFYEMKKYEQAMKDIKQAYSIDKNVPEVNETYRKIHAALKEHDEQVKKKQKEMYKKMVNEGSSLRESRSDKVVEPKVEQPKVQSINPVQQSKATSHEVQETIELEPVIPQQSSTSKWVTWAVGSAISIALATKLTRVEEKASLVIAGSVASGLLVNENRVWKSVGALGLVAAATYLWNKFR